MISIRKYDPVVRFSQDLDRIFGTDFPVGMAVNDESGCLFSNLPKMDVKELAERIVVQMDLPGMEQKDIQVTVENNVLTIAGERRFEKKDEKDKYHRVERSYGKFSRSFSLPALVQTDKIAASYQNGVLEIQLPKREEVKPRTLTIQVN